jgi:hydrogenase maturation protein HypF
MPALRTPSRANRHSGDRPHANPGHAMKDRLEERIYDLRGIVQGVGFRPTLARLARAERLAGWVQNRADRVRLQLSGPAAKLENFIAALPERIPPSATIDSVELVSARPIDESEIAPDFAIRDSAAGEQGAVPIPADLAICRDCARELFDPTDRRYGYPFTTCTACGPRYTVVNAMPYDRERTTLADFPLCPQCRSEYEDPSNRRYHAESIACPACGPRIWLEDVGGRSFTADALPRARQELADGKILALRGIGGYLLAADAFNTGSLRTLRTRKRRPHKPFALMARNIETLRRYAKISPAESALIASPVAPIVILELKPDSGLDAALINPDNNTVGVMLPTSPLHALLFEPLQGDPTPAFELLVMTSGNQGGEPICISNEEARDRLAGIADLLLCHDREINLRSDDSIFALQHGGPQVWRRARGCAPDAINLPHPLGRSVLAMGAELKNTIALGADSRIIPSPHIGDLADARAVHALERVAGELPRFLNIQPDCVAVDLHPDMQSTRLGNAIAAAAGLPLRRIQHHHAHAMSCLAEHGRDQGLALVMDGTGLGGDGMIWGAELLEVSPEGYRRLASFAPAPLPGGDAASMRPARQLIARLIQAGIDLDEETLRRLAVGADELEVWRRQIENNLNTPYTTAAGRVFDSFAALLGLCPGPVSYDAQAAIRLEAAAERARRHGRKAAPLPFHHRERDGLLEIDWSSALESVIDMPWSQRDPELIALAFHESFCAASIRMIEHGLAASSQRAVALSGGVMMNRLFTELIADKLAALGIEPLLHRRIPPNDGGISTGQVLIAGSTL